jgi:hypothetical protein
MTTQPVPHFAPRYERKLHLPDPAQIDDAELKKAITECQGLRQRAESAQNDAGDAGFKVEAAEADDRQREAVSPSGEVISSSPITWTSRPGRNMERPSSSLPASFGKGTTIPSKSRRRSIS